MRLFTFLSLFTLLHLNALAQQDILFNSTEHDFGEIAQNAIAFEHDFIFRNTGFVPVTVLSAKSSSEHLSFIHTKSDVYTGEYGFIKVKLNPSSSAGIQNDEVFVMMQAGEEILTTILYIRVEITDQGLKDNGRAFLDTEIATSVEVSPEDIENLEGFFGQDRMTQLESELEYLRKQVQIKADIISKLNTDLQERKERELAQVDQLKHIEKALETKSESNKEDALKQVNALASQLEQIQAQDESMRLLIANQEEKYVEAKRQADSARNYASALSIQLQEQFEAEAKAIEKAARLETDLAQKEKTAALQQAAIDSLEMVLNENLNSDSLAKEISALKETLIWKQNEEYKLSALANKQSQEIDKLTNEKSQISLFSDSLRGTLSELESENATLQHKLVSTDNRISQYKLKLDSLKHQALNAEINQAREQSTLDSLNNALTQLASSDAQMRKTIQEKEQNLQRLLDDKQETEKTLNALEFATTKQLEQANQLLNQINTLSKKESDAKKETKALELKLAQSARREESAKAAIQVLRNELIEDKTELAKKETELEESMVQLEKTTDDMLMLKAELAKKENSRYRTTLKLDSLQQVADKYTENELEFQQEIKSLQEAIIASHNEENALKLKTEEIESALKNAHLSNDLTFDELKGEVRLISNERDNYKAELLKAKQRIQALESSLNVAEKNAKNAEAFAKELGYQHP